MKQLNLLLLACLLLAGISGLQAQNFGDALRYSQFDPTGTARFIGAGSALGPLGADFSVITSNPAGLAWMQRSEFVITPGVYSNQVETRLSNGDNNGIFEDSQIRLNLPNIGLVIASRSGRNWSTFNFALGLNRLADYNQEFYYQGLSKGSIVNRFEELANGAGLDDFEAGLAFDADALLEENGIFFSDFTDVPDAVIEREQIIDREGGLSELSFGFAGNYQNRVMWGLAVGIPILNYREDKEYFESDPNDEVFFFDDLAYREQLSVTGGGINLKLGMILRLEQALRLGFAIHTPTFYQINEIYTTDMTYNYTIENDSFTGEAFSPEGNFSYNLQTPWRFLAGAGFIFGKNGFLSGEIEYVDYSKNRFGFDGFSADEREVNDATRDNLSNALKVSLGAEYAYDIFRFRGGLGLQQAPVADDDTFYNTVSAGLGIRQQRFFVDFAYQRRAVNSTFTPYLTFDAPQQFIDIDNTNERFVVSVGFKM